ncbi:hypothetical protein BD408DRAFT_149579 [Parasitella parasitica]|nr:hypothetical protein BD408DRAFT_149579 [Parasitella parasitica]
MGRNVSSDLKKIEKDYHFVEGSLQGSLDLASYCKSKGVIRRATVSLENLCQKVLKRSLLKDNSTPRLSDWGMDKLSESQILYAAKDAFVSVEIFKALEYLEVVGAPIYSPSGYIGKYVSIHNKYASGRAMAYRFIEEERMARPKMWSKILINVTEVCVPGAFIFGEDKSLESFGKVPFKVIVDLAQHTLVTARDPDQDEPDEADFIPNDANAMLNSLPTRVLKDVFHLMDMIPINLNHGMSKEFSRKFRDALFVNNIDDEEMIRNYLNGLPDGDPNKTTFDQLIKKRPGWALKRIRRYVPKPEELVPTVEALFRSYEDAKCAVSGLPLFDKRCKKVAKSVLETIRKGHVSDPPGVSWYYHMYTDRLGFPVYRCTRGTNSIEGGVHQNIVRKFASFNASPALTDCALADYRLRHNIQVGSKNRYGVTYKGHFSPWIKQAINFMRCKLGQPVLKSYSDPSGNAFYFSAIEESFGISKLSPSLLNIYNMKKHEKEYQNSQKYFTTKEKLDLCGNTSIFITPKIRSVFGNMQYNYVSYMQGLQTRWLLASINQTTGRSLLLHGQKN